jgi:hypothetical protein
MSFLGGSSRPAPPPPPPPDNTAFNEALQSRIDAQQVQIDQQRQQLEERIESQESRVEGERLEQLQAVAAKSKTRRKGRRLLVSQSRPSPEVGLLDDPVGSDVTLGPSPSRKPRRAGAYNA